MGSAPRRSLCAALALCALWPAGVAAAPHVRTGLCVGVGFGMESVSWTDEDGDRRVEGSGVGNARAGYAIRDDLMLGVEFWGWAKEYDIDTFTLPVPVEVTLTSTTLAVTHYPGNAGFFIRVGAGLAYARVKVEPPPSVTDVPAADENETGFAAGIAPGYEWRITQKFALGGQGDLVYMGLDTLKDTFGYGVSAQFNWYW